MVVLNYPGLPIEVYNSDAMLFAHNGYSACELAFEIADIPIEQGGDISASVTVGYDENCNPIPAVVTIGRTVDSPNNDRSCDDGVTECVEVLVSIVCNPLP